MTLGELRTRTAHLPDNTALMGTFVLPCVTQTTGERIFLVESAIAGKLYDAHNRDVLLFILGTEALQKK